MSRDGGVRAGIYRSALVRRIARLLDAAPHPLLACEITPEYVAAARWSRRGGNLEELAVAPLPAGAIRASAVEANLVSLDAVRAAIAGVFGRVGAHNQAVALLIPDPVVRVFVLHFDTFPRSAAEAVPLLRWRLKKSVPFEAEETLISFMRQAPREDGVDIVTGLARLRIVREYEALVETAGFAPGVVLSSTLAALPLLDDERPAMLLRLSGTALSTAIVRGGILCGFRCTDLPAAEGGVSPQVLLDEVYPVAAYYQDSWQEGIQKVRLSGLGNRLEEFRGLLEQELHCPVGSLLGSAEREGRLSGAARPLTERNLDALAGWMMSRSG